MLPPRVGPLEQGQDFFVAAQWEPPRRKGPFFIAVLGRLRRLDDRAAAAEELRLLNRRLFPVWQASYQDEKASWAMRDLKAHVVGANYTLIGVDNGDATATFTLTSAGEADLISPTFAASTWNNVGTATIMTDTCGDSVPSGTSCQITVAFTFNADEAASAYGYILLQASGNTRQQAPVRLTLLLPPKD